MIEIILYSIASVSAIGIIAAIILFFVAKKFYVYEDPKIDDLENILPAANCGGCGYPGCRNFAENCVKAENLDVLYCPVGGNDLMANVAKMLGKEVVAKDPLVAVIRCSGSPEHRKKTTIYDGSATCKMESALYAGHTDCQFGCLGHGDCVDVCDFEAIYMDKKTGLPVVVDDNCTACGACVTTCPKDIIELRKKNKKDRKIFVSCINQDKGGVAKKACSVACIGCKLCVKECKFDAIVVENFLAFIDSEKCKLCRKCVAVCPTSAILEINFPVRKIKTDKPKPKVETKKTEEKKELDKKETTVKEEIKQIAEKEVTKEVISTKPEK